MGDRRLRHRGRDVRARARVVALKRQNRRVYKPLVRNQGAPVKREIAWVVVFAVVLACVGRWQLITSYPHTLAHDGFLHHKMIEAARISVSRYHELPLWNPFECGGMALWDNPQGVAAAPEVWLTLLIGTTRTIEVWYFLHTAAGILSMWALARLELRMSSAASLVAAASWALAGVHSVHITGGGVAWVQYLYFPMALFLWRRAEESVWAAVGLGLVAALIMYEGGAYPLSYLAVLLGAETLLRVWPPSRLPRVLRAAAVVVVVTLAVGAPRFFPVMDQLTHHHRDIAPDTDSMTWATLKDIFLERDRGRFVEAQQYVWPEYAAYVGPLLLSLAAMGLLLLGRGELWLLVLFGFSFSLMVGHVKPWAPWSVLNAYVYPFKQMRVPSRFVVMVTLFLSVFVGVAVDRIPRLFRRRVAARGDVLKGALVALACIGIGDEMRWGESLLTNASMWSIPALSGAPQDFTGTPAPRLYFGLPIPPPPPTINAKFVDAPYSNIADNNCWEEWAFERDAPLWLGDVPQARAVTSNITVEHVDRTQNGFTIDIEAKGPGRILLNSTYDRGWRSDHGNVIEQAKMLAVDLPSGSYAMRVYYWPHGLTLGFIVAGVSIPGLIALYVVRRRQRRARPS
jgi:hypothetical protein